MKILLTSTSFQDTPGQHHSKLKETGFDVDTLRGPIKECVLIPIIADYDGIICGDDEITERVITTGKHGKLKAISKYGVGLDKIDVEAAKRNHIPVTNCPDVNHISVAEHVMALILTFLKNIHIEHNHTQRGEWKRLIGTELFEKKIGIVGFGRIGREVAIRAQGFGMNVCAFDPYLSEKKKKTNKIHFYDSLVDLIKDVNILSLNLPLNSSTRGLISQYLIKQANPGMLLVNTSRYDIVSHEAILFGLTHKILSGYLTDVLDEEPMQKDHPLLKFPNVIITPHIGSRTFESVQKQGIMAVANLLSNLRKR